MSLSLKTLVVDLDPDGLRVLGHLVEGAERVFERGTHDLKSNPSSP